MQKNKEITRYLLGAEEYALSFSMINRPDLARNILQSLAPNDAKEQIEARLTAASHSLAARGLALISERGSAQLEKGLEQALLPMAKSSKTVQFSQVTAEEQTFISINTYLNKSFAAHRVLKGVIHQIDYGDYSALVEYILGQFELFGDKELNRSIENNHHLTLGLLGRLVKEREAASKTAEVLMDAGIAQDVALQLASDIENQQMRGTVMILQARENGSKAHSKSKTEKTYLVLKGPQHSWVFEFNQAGDHEIAQIHSVNRKQFTSILQSVLN